MVSNDAGTQFMNIASQTTQVASFSVAPTEPRIYTDDQLEQVYGAQFQELTEMNFDSADDDDSGEAEEVLDEEIEEAGEEEEGEGDEAVEGEEVLEVEEALEVEDIDEEIAEEAAEEEIEEAEAELAAEELGEIAPAAGGEEVGDEGEARIGDDGVGEDFAALGDIAPAAGGDIDGGAVLGFGVGDDVLVGGGGLDIDLPPPPPPPPPLPADPRPGLVVSDAAGAEDSGIRLDITAAFSDLAGSETITLTISDISSGATISLEGTEIELDIDTTDEGSGSVTLEGITQEELDTLEVAPPPGSGSDFTLTVTAQADESDDTAVSEATIEVTVTSIADAPVVTVLDVEGREDTAITLDVSASLGDADGSEVLSVTVAGVPLGATLSAGTDNGDGSWTLTAGQLDGLTIMPPADSGADFTLLVSANVDRHRPRYRRANDGDLGADAVTGRGCRGGGCAEPRGPRCRRRRGRRHRARCQGRAHRGGGLRNRAGDDRRRPRRGDALGGHRQWRRQLDADGGSTRWADDYPGGERFRRLHPASKRHFDRDRSRHRRGDHRDDRAGGDGGHGNRSCRYAGPGRERRGRRGRRRHRAGREREPRRQRRLRGALGHDRGRARGRDVIVGTDNGDGSWTLTAGQLDGLTITPPEDSGADFTLQVLSTATATETDPDTGIVSTATTGARGLGRHGDRGGGHAGA